MAQWSDWSLPKALAVIWCESKGNPFAKNPHSSAANLFQILGASLGDGPPNIALAHDIYVRRGWSPWVCA